MQLSSPLAGIKPTSLGDGLLGPCPTSESLKGAVWPGLSSPPQVVSCNFWPAVVLELWHLSIRSCRSLEIREEQVQLSKILGISGIATFANPSLFLCLLSLLYDVMFKNWWAVDMVIDESPSNRQCLRKQLYREQRACSWSRAGAPC